MVDSLASREVHGLIPQSSVLGPEKQYFKEGCSATDKELGS